MNLSKLNYAHSFLTKNMYIPFAGFSQFIYEKYCVKFTFNKAE
jgi:hypothetical protein